jgi:two-component system, NarL family, sensor kinase
MVNENNDIIVLIIAGSILLILLAVFIIYFFYLYQKRQQKNFKETQLLQSQFSQALLQSQLEIQEQTLKNISQEIHDNIGQVLSLAKLNLGTVSLEKPEQLQQKINDSRQLVAKAIQDLRDLSRSMDADHISSIGFAKALEDELQMIGKSGYAVQLEVAGNRYRLDLQKELILFRIVQEILHNIIKHAKANQIQVYINYLPDLFELKIIDDGIGFDLSPLNENGNSNFGLGIRNMHNRAKLIGGEFAVHSELGKGTLVTIRLPKENNSSSYHEDKQ